MSTELPLSTNTLLVANPFIPNMMTSGLSWGCFIPLTSRSENMISSFSDRRYFRDGCFIWTLLTHCNTSSSKTCMTLLIRALLLSFISPLWLALEGIVRHPWHHHGFYRQPLTEVGDPSWWTFEAFLVGSALLSAPSNRSTRQYNGSDLYGNGSTSLGHASLRTYSTAWATLALVHPLSTWEFCPPT